MNVNSSAGYSTLYLNALASLTPSIFFNNLQVTKEVKEVKSKKLKRLKNIRI